MCNFTTETLIAKLHADILSLVGHNKIVTAHITLVGSSFGKCIPLKTELK